MTNFTADAGTKLLGRTLDDLYDFAKDKVTASINKARIQQKIPELVQKINNFRTVKTLWQMERPVDIEDFYCDSHLIIPRGSKVSPATKRTQGIRRKIDSVSDFGNIGNIIIRGIAGQGKSIFLRHLFIREFELGHRIPIFIELRKIQENESLLDHISRFLDILDLKIDTRLFRILARSGKLVIFLDAFDEVPEKEKPRILTQLEYLVESCPGSQFVITTRPNSGIETSALFTVTTLDNLQNDEYQGVIRKLSAKAQFANSLIKAIKTQESTVSDVLCTPLLVSLLIIQYASFQKLPQRMSDFYESIFTVLLQRHDSSKAGFVRQRLCSLNDHQYRDIFNALCFESMKIGSSQLSHELIQKVISQAMEIVGVKEEPLNFLSDILKVTCLLLKEGEEYHFIHKSVKEYYAASFISNRSENTATTFYGLCKSEFGVYEKWQEVLAFLSEIDKYRYYKHYIIPLCCKWLNVDDSANLVASPPTLTRELAKHIFSGFLIGFDTGENNNTFSSLRYGNISQILPDEGKIVDHLFNLEPGELLTKIVDKTIAVNKELFSHNYYHSKFGTLMSEQELIISIEQIIDEGFLLDELTSLATLLVHDIHEIWIKAYLYTTKEDSLDVSFNMSL